MAKRLIHMTWDEVQKEMSIAGDPAKITQLGRQIMAMIQGCIIATNRAELTNVEFMLQRILAEIKGEQRRYDTSRKHLWKNL